MKSLVLVVVRHLKVGGFPGGVSGLMSLEMETCPSFEKADVAVDDLSG